MSKVKTNIRTVYAIATAFDPGKRGWKLTADGKAVELRDGNPVWIDDSGNETTMGGDTISRLNGEAKRHRERAEAAEALAAKFKDIDPDKAREAFETLSKIDQKKLIDAGEVDRVRKEIGDQFTAKLAEKDQTQAALSSKLNDMMLSTAFTSSKFVQERIAIPVEMVRATFGNRFKIKDDKIVALTPDGSEMVSPKRAGEYANFDEAIEAIIEAYPHKDAVLKAPGASGSGNGGGGGGRGGKGPVYRRAEFEKMLPAEQSHVSQLVNKGEAQLVD